MTPLWDIAAGQMRGTVPMVNRAIAPEPARRVEEVDRLVREIIEGRFQDAERRIATSSAPPRSQPWPFALWTTCAAVLRVREGRTGAGWQALYVAPTFGWHQQPEYADVLAVLAGVALAVRATDLSDLARAAALRAHAGDADREAMNRVISLMANAGVSCAWGQ